MDQALKLDTVDVEQLVGRDDFNPSQQVGGRLVSARDAGLNRATRHTDFVDQVTVFCDHRMVGLASQDIDCAAFEIALLGIDGEQRASLDLGDPSARIILIEGALHRATQQVALGAVRIDDAEASVGLAIGCFERLADFRDVGDLPPEDEELTLGDVCLKESSIPDETPRLTRTAVEVALNLLEQRLEATGRADIERAFADLLDRGDASPSLSARFTSD